jgi:hypothetical protein
MSLYTRLGERFAKFLSFRQRGNRSRAGNFGKEARVVRKFSKYLER